MAEVRQGLGFDRTEKRWGDLEPNDYVIAKDGVLWRLLEGHDGVWKVENWVGAEKLFWRPQDPDRMVPIAILHPADPVSLLREKLGGIPFAFRRNDEGIWICAPWRTEKPGNEPLDLYKNHLVEFHGIKVPGREYDHLLEYHREHHTQGITHKIAHTHPERG